MPNLVYIFIEDGASREDLKNVESLLSDLREICRKEEEFHDSECDSKFVYLANIWYIDSEAEEYQRTASTRIEADTEDSELLLENIRKTVTDKADPRETTLNNGKAKIYVN